MDIVRVSDAANPLAEDEYDSDDFDEGELANWRAAQQFMAEVPQIMADNPPAANTSAVAEEMINPAKRPRLTVAERKNILNRHLALVTQLRDEAKRKYDETVDAFVDSVWPTSSESPGTFPWWLFPEYDRPRRPLYAFRSKMAYYRRRGFRRYRRRSYGRKRSSPRLPFGVGAYARGLSRGLRSRSRRNSKRKLTILY